jgi:hypothetical protein
VKVVLVNRLLIRIGRLRVRTEQPRCRCNCTGGCAKRAFGTADRREVFPRSAKEFTGGQSATGRDGAFRRR